MGVLKYHLAAEKCLGLLQGRLGLSSTSCSRGQLLDGTKQSASLNSIGLSSLNPILPTSCLRYYNQSIKKTAKQLNILVPQTLPPCPQLLYLLQYFWFAHWEHSSQCCCLLWFKKLSKGRRNWVVS